MGIRLKLISSSYITIFCVQSQDWRAFLADAMYKTMREEIDTARQFAAQLAARDKRIVEIVGIESLVENKEKKVDSFLVTGQFHEFNQARVRASPGAPRYRHSIAIETTIKFH